MKYFQGLIYLILCVTAFGQVDGSWQGVLIQNNNGATMNFAVWVDIKTNGAQITGSFRSEQANSPYFKVSNIIGKIDGDSVVFKEKTIINHKTEGGMWWCLILAHFTYNKLEQKLKGSYISQTEGCIPGELVLIRANKGFNHGTTKSTESSSLERVEKLLAEKKTVVGRQFVLTDVNYQSGKYNIITSSYTYLNKIVGMLKKNMSIKVHLKGHTDSDGDDEGNFLLSQKRAKSVSDFLIKKGIEEGRITYEGYGESRSITSNQSKEGKRVNRRVELLIISD